MNYDNIQSKILEIYKYSNISTFPFDCFDLLDRLMIKYHSYSSLSEKKHEACLQISKDAFILKNEIYYNDENISGRIKFSLMHELAHIYLKHSKSRSKYEELEANYFASNILAPRMAIHYARCKSSNDVCNIFKITSEASMYAFEDYKAWYKRKLYTKMSLLDKEMYNHFYDTASKKFVYNSRPCIYCDTIVKNSLTPICALCNINYASIRPNQDIYEQQVKRLHNNWLYSEY